MTSSIDVELSGPVLQLIQISIRLTIVLPIWWARVTCVGCLYLSRKICQIVDESSTSLTYIGNKPREIVANRDCTSLFALIRSFQGFFFPIRSCVVEVVNIFRGITKEWSYANFVTLVIQIVHITAKLRNRPISLTSSCQGTPGSLWRLGRPTARQLFSAMGYCTFKFTSETPWLNCSYRAQPLRWMKPTSSTPAPPIFSFAFTITSGRCCRRRRNQSTTCYSMWIPFSIISLQPTNDSCFEGTNFLSFQWLSKWEKSG